MKKLLTLILLSVLTLTFFSTGKVVVAVPQDPDFLDPHKASASGTYEMMFNVFEGLLKPDSSGNVIPAVASDYSVSSDGLTYTFTLRDGVKFHDGNPVTMDDVLYSLNRLRGNDGEKALSSDFENFVESITALDGKTVEIKLNQLNSDFLGKFVAAILPKDNDDHNKNPIGTGPFRFKEYAPGQKVVLAKFDDYWKKGVPNLDEVEFRIITETQASLMSFMAGEVQMLPRADAIQAELLRDRFNLTKVPQNMVQLMTMNIARKPFDNLKVRQAINYAIDKDEIIEIVANGYGTKLGSNMSPIMKKYYQEGLEDYYATDLVKARELLVEAGYPAGFSTTITVPSNYQIHVDAAQVITEQLKKIGINVSIEQVEWGVWLDRVYKGREYDMTVIVLTGKLNAYDILKRYLSTYDYNFMNYSNSEYDEIINSAIKEIDEEKKIDLYKKAQTILTHDAAAVYIMDPNFIAAMAPELDGYTVYPLYVQDMSTIHYK